MNPRLAEILAEKRKEVARLKKRGLSTFRSDNLPPIRDFKGAISVPGRIGLIAEIKFASPSAGMIREGADALSVARIYEDSGAAAISLLTDKRFFGGDIDQLPHLKRAVSLPILRKDFVMDEVQVKESFLYGADAILLIARILSRQQLKKLVDMCKKLGLSALTEIHDRHDLEKALDCGAEIIGINNRDLDTFDVDPRVTLELAPLVPERCIAVSESGISSGDDIRLFRKYGVSAVLVGTSLMRSDDIKLKAQELVRAGDGSEV
ncbi:MAG: indole-3-glycerol phosphate synthase TrpC [Desulfobacterales bacterium]|nr:indole-3-glycerol phosphate synthase TrpC [Pseudomonadota bacterium]MCG2775164.1 indole-3-glycerol phosphate synthase TrpC [Desulfobacterales bacterium]